MDESEEIQRLGKTFIKIKSIDQFKTEKDALYVAFDNLEHVLANVNAIEYEKYIQSQTKPYAVEHVIYNSTELTQFNTINMDSDKNYFTKYEYESLDEPIRPKTDRWTSNICKVKVVEKIDYSDFDFINENLILSESFITHKTSKTISKFIIFTSNFRYYE